MAQKTQCEILIRTTQGIFPFDKVFCAWYGGLLDYECPMKALKGMKFGGTSMGTAAAMRQVIQVVRGSKKDARVAAVVVSAMSGVTDQLIKIANLSAAKDRSYRKLLAELEARHIKTVKALISQRHRAGVLVKVKTLLSYLTDVVQSVYLVGELSKMGVSTVDTVTNFILADLKTDAKPVYQALLKKGVIIRPMTAWGLDQFIRVTIGKREENKRFIGALKQILK